MNDPLQNIRKTTRRWLLFGRMAKLLSVLFLASSWAGTAFAQVDAVREFRSDLFPPDLILREAESLGLTDKQRDAVEALVKETKQSFADGRLKLRDTTESLGKSLKASSVAEQTVLDQFTAILEAEKEIKRAQFSMLVRAKNLLTPSQQEKLRRILENQPPKGAVKQAPTSTDSSRTDVRQELNARMQKVQAGVDRWRSEGRDPGPILDLMKTFADQMQAGKLPEAKETLQSALDRLNQVERR